LVVDVVLDVLPVLDELVPLGPVRNAAGVMSPLPESPLPESPSPESPLPPPPPSSLPPSPSPPLPSSEGSAAA
jgi:hypothetical protein